jgi:hypothetical protein
MKVKTLIINDLPLESSPVLFVIEGTTKKTFKQQQRTQQSRKARKAAAAMQAALEHVNQSVMQFTVNTTLFDVYPIVKPTGSTRRKGSAIENELRAERIERQTAAARAMQTNLF